MQRYVTDAGRHGRAKLGFVLLAVEQTMEDDIFHLRPPGVGVHFTRASSTDGVGVETLEATASGIGDAATLLLPNGHLDVVCYACTSNSVILGEDRVFAELNRGKPGARTTSIITSVMRALQRLEVRRVAIATPYPPETDIIERDYMTSRGFDIVNIEGLGIENDADMMRVTPQSIFDFACAVDRPAAEALFISCGALRSIDVISRLEDRIGKPVVTSNQAMMWDCLRLAGIADQREDCGRLFREH